MVRSALDVRERFARAGARRRAARPRGVPGRLRALPRRRPGATSDGRVPQPRRRRLRADGLHADPARATRTSCAPTSRRCRSAPRARSRAWTQLHLSRIQIIDALVDQGPPHRRETLKRRTCSSRARSTATSTPTSTRSASASAPRPTAGGATASATRAPRDRAAFRRWIRAHKVDTSLLAVANPGATVRDVRESLALRERVVDFAADAQGLDARDAARALPGQLRGRALMAGQLRLGRPRNLPRRAARAGGRSTSPTSRATSCAATRFPSAAYLFLHIDDVDARPRAADAGAAAGRDGRAVADGARDARSSVAFTYAGLRALGVPDGVLDELPRGVPRGHGGARRAGSATAGRARPSTGRPAWAPARRTCSSTVYGDRRGAPRAAR